MICDTENEIIHISRQILYTYFVENQQDYLLSLIADDMVFVGMGKHLKAEGRQAICQMFTAGREQMFPCIMTDETYIARPLGKDYWFCEAQSDLETQPGLPIFSHECQRTTFIYRRNPDARSGLGWELVHLNNSVAWKQIRPQELFAWSSSMKNYDGELSNQVQHLLSLRINSIGESHPRHLRGRLFNKFNTSFNFSGVTLWKSVPLG